MKNKQKSVVRPAHIIFLAVAVVITLLLAWWQWTRFRSGSGTLQNLGYALQWPIFGGALVWAYRRYVRLESELTDGEALPAEASVTGALTSEGQPAELMVPQRPTIDVEEFNRLNTPRRGHYEGDR